MGSLFASYLEIDANNSLMAYLNKYLMLIDQSNTGFPMFFSLYWEIIRWPLAAAVFGMTLLSVGAVPCIFAIRGFLLSYTVSMFLRLYGIQGTVPAAAIFGISGAISVVALFLIGTKAFAIGAQLCSVKSEYIERTKAQKQFLKQVATTLLWAGGGALLHSWLTPYFLRAAAGIIS